LPARTASELEAQLPESPHGDVIGAERRVNRPQEEEKQKEKYSGKKHTR
jgi:hypothetical protein